MKKEFKEFLRVATKSIDKLLEEVAQDLIESDEDEYCIGEDDYGCYNNGVGWASFGKEKVFDEQRAFEHAVDKVANNLRDMDSYYLQCLLEDDDFRKALVDLIRSR